MNKRADLIVVTLLLSLVIWKQEQLVNAEPGDEPPAAEPAPHDPPQSPSVRLEEVTVTAQRREESAQDVPVSIKVFSDQNMEERGVRRTTDLLEATPNMNFTSFQSGLSGGSVSMRGISAVAGQVVEDGMGFYVDDIFVGTQRALNIDLLDLEQVEILRGPQGTLYGRNALGGAIHFRSKQPSAERSGTLNIEYGNYDFRKVRASVNLPLVPDLALSRFALTYTERDGTVKNLFDGRRINDLENLGGRGQLRFLPTDTLDISLSGDYSHDDATRSAFGPFDDVVHQRVNIFKPATEQRDLYGFSGKLIASQPRFTLTAITGVRGASAKAAASDFIPVNNLLQGYDSQQQQVSQELRVHSPAGNRLRWVGGFFYYHEERDEQFVLGLPMGSPAGLPPGYRETSDTDIETNSYAVFADATATLLEQLEVTLGVRFSYDDRSLAYRHGNSLGIPGAFVPAQTAKRQAVFNDWSPRFVASYHWTRQFLTYASISHGYKAGAFNFFLVGDSQFKFDSESGWNYEVGAKWTLFDERMIFNVAAFYFDWQDPQAIVFNGFVTTTGNADSARSFGGDCELIVRPLTGLELAVEGGYADATFLDYKNFAPGKDATGNRVPFTSKFSANAAVQYRRPLTSWMGFMVRWDVAYKSSSFYDVANTIKEPDYVLVNVRLGLESERWDLFVFARNLLDEGYRTMGFFFPTTMSPVGVPGDPRTYGVEVRVRF